MRAIPIGDKRVGPGEPCFIIAEAGSNHSGSLVTAKELINIASEAHADAVKFQLFRASKLYPRSAGASDYLAIPKSIHEIVSEMEMPYDWLPELHAHCEMRDVQFLCSAFDEDSIDTVDPYVTAHKVASYELTHHPLVRPRRTKEKTDHSVYRHGQDGRSLGKRGGHSRGGQ